MLVATQLQRENSSVNSSKRAYVSVANKDTNLSDFILVPRIHSRNKGIIPIKRHSLTLPLQQDLPSHATTTSELDTQRNSVLRRRKQMENQMIKSLLCYGP
jgi:hypothetical protein